MRVLPAFGASLVAVAALAGTDAGGQEPVQGGWELSYDRRYAPVSASVSAVLTAPSGTVVEPRYRLDVFGGNGQDLLESTTAVPSVSDDGVTVRLVIAPGRFIPNDLMKIYACPSGDCSGEGVTEVFVHNTDGGPGLRACTATRRATGIAPPGVTKVSARETDAERGYAISAKHYAGNPRGVSNPITSGRIAFTRGNDYNVETTFKFAFTPSRTKGKKVYGDRITAASWQHRDAIDGRPVRITERQINYRVGRC